MVAATPAGPTQRCGCRSLSVDLSGLMQKGRGSSKLGHVKVFGRGVRGGKASPKFSCRLRQRQDARVRRSSRGRPGPRAPEFDGALLQTSLSGSLLLIWYTSGNESPNDGRGRAPLRRSPKEQAEVSHAACESLRHPNCAPTALWRAAEHCSSGTEGVTRISRQPAVGGFTAPIANRLPSTGARGSSQVRGQSSGSLA
jgi:hypothetical protein